MKVNYTLNNRREPLYQRPREKLELCPDCKTILWMQEAQNDGAECKCGVWWWTFPSPYLTTSQTDDSGWHFKVIPATPNQSDGEGDQ